MSRRLAEGAGAHIAAETAARAALPDTVRAVIALGANLGDLADTMLASVREIADLPDTELIAAAQPIESVAVTLDGPDDEAPRYLNSVVIVETALTAPDLLSHLHRIEAEHGRERRERWGARTLDLDLITYGDVRSADEKLLLPHPRAAERSFVLAPWLSIDPGAEIPGVGRVVDLLAAVEAQP